jgi:ethanolamine ammonia-lyase small subunit
MDAWHSLRQFTQARIAQGRSGSSLPTAAWLEFQLAHAAARDAVLQAWDVEGFQEGVGQAGLKSLVLNTRAASRDLYLQRPDLGRCLDDDSRAALESSGGQTVDVALIISNGLSSTATDRHGLDLLQALVASLVNHRLSYSPVCLVPNARVALSDEIGALLQARLAIIVVGERPGLSAADSLGAYLTYAPQRGRTDADRNCLSNIRPPEGLGHAEAAIKLTYLASKALRGGFGGVTLKDDMANAFDRLGDPGGGHHGVADILT